MQTHKYIRSLVQPSKVYMTLTDIDPDGKKIDPVLVIYLNSTRIGLIPLQSLVDWLNLMLPSFWLPQLMIPDTH